MTVRPETMHGTYHKIPTVWKRSPETHELIVGQPRSEEIGFLEECLWTWQEKIDGTNIRVHWDGQQVHFAGKTDRANLAAMNILPALEERFGGEKNAQLFEQIFNDQPVTLYGEGFGGKIQAGSDYSPVETFALFDVRARHTWYRQEAVKWVAEELGIWYAPVVGEGTLMEATEFAREGFGSRWGTRQAEGIIVRPLVEVASLRGERIIGKLKTGDFQ